MAPTDPSTRRPKRKRSRKARTAISSSEESASEAEKPTVIQPASVHSDSASDDDDDDDDAAPSTMEAESDFDQEYPDTAALDIHDDEGVDDALQPPSLLLPRSGPTDVSTPSKTMMHARLTSMTDAQISQELTEKQRDAFHALYMQALTDEFGDELDEIRQVRCYFLTHRTTPCWARTQIRVKRRHACRC